MAGYSVSTHEHDDDETEAKTIYLSFVSRDIYLPPRPLSLVHKTMRAMRDSANQSIQKQLDSSLPGHRANFNYGHRQTWQVHPEQCPCSPAIYKVQNDR